MFLIMIFIILLTISIILFLINSSISKKTFLNLNKLTPFECGFDPLSKPRLPFSLQFYLISIIFLIFDVEFTLIIPMLTFYNFKNYLIMILTGFIFMNILLFGLFIEWKEGTFCWTK
uniref:NADH-ubiquinone oxidoreductase chain 3 n=1 Tax=Helorus sp. ZJUH_2016017 TaxID=2491159 RepID=A0A3Q8UA38_9HYME|nr:NADH dehydrogenase subunit 3 [Helorus sp. ZJUH_2016017]